MCGLMVAVLDNSGKIVNAMVAAVMFANLLVAKVGKAQELDTRN